MNVYHDEMTPEERAMHVKRCMLRDQLRGDAIAASEDGKAHCTYCRDELSKSKARLSHIVPPAQGGETIVGNVVLCCPSCAESKNGRTLFSCPERNKR